ncbi:adenylate kinase isoenzyme 6-like [Macrosteles quadrilineatus]|uniref:adenylate kinase isoenzyme 6-like n=1 Tax=Macrosteles quadrilineatus TaxID=74068 RepID=UPI0023E21F90|nr:adenylate kinase isoenzyme 6-like [Macrosteles quadrilineatus]
MTSRKLPNILITGTPGVGKSTLCAEIAKRTGFEWLEVGKIAKEHECYEGYDNVYECPVLDEDKLLDELETRVAPGGKILDYHSCEFFPERWFDAVYVLRTDTKYLFDRLKARGYSGKKFDDNIQCEIFQTILDEARESYKPEIVFELQSNTDDDTGANICTIVDWIEKWKKDNGNH